MSDWSIELPCADRSDHITELPGLIGRAVSDGQLTESQGAIAREIEERLLLEGGCETVGDALDRVDGLDEATRRQWLDEARTARGLPSIAVVEQRRADARFESAFQRLQPPDPPKWSPLQRCPAKGCNAYPTKGGGAWAEVDCWRWWCEEHRAGHEDDLQPYEPPYRVTGTGRLIPSERERKRIAEWTKQRDEKQEREQRKREEHQAREAAALTAVRERYAETATISVLGHKVRVKDGVIVS